MPAPRSFVRGRASLTASVIAPAVLALLPPETASRYRAIVFDSTVDKNGRTVLSLATVRPDRNELAELVRFLEENNDVDVVVFEATDADIDAQLARYLATTPETLAGGPAIGVTSLAELQGIIQTAVIPAIITGIITFALAKAASDIHIEPLEEEVRIRYRLDGILMTIISLPRYFRAALISRVKIMANLKIDEQRVPQDGRFEFDWRDHTIDVRVSSFPTVHGEKVVLRLLDKDSGVKTLEQLGVTGGGFDALVKAIARPHGVILATGPTGSGKSTTLYAILNRIATPAKNVVTLEDPVEYEITGTNQSQVKPSIGYTFAEGLRSVLRQDPNIIMVGEIRDLETATMVTHAALTGHLVLSTLHTNNAASALPRLINIGVEPYLLTSSLSTIIAQRLVRKLCPACRLQTTLPPALTKTIRAELEAIKDFALPSETPLVFYRAVGCEECQDGYKGRIGIFEVLTMNDAIESAAVAKRPATTIASAAVAAGMMTMKQDGILKALKGITTIDEIWRVTTEEET